MSDFVLDHTMMRVEDLDAALDWYQTHLGLEPDWDTDDFVRLTGDGGAALGIHRPPHQTLRRGPEGRHEVELVRPVGALGQRVIQEDRARFRGYQLRRLLQHLPEEPGHVRLVRQGGRGLRPLQEAVQLVPGKRLEIAHALTWG